MKSEMSTPDQRLVDQIESAFCGRRAPSGDNVATLQHSRGRGDAADVASCFGGREWQSISFDELKMHENDLPLLTVPAFCYYIPAYMRACVVHGSRIGGIWIYLSTALSPPPLDAAARWNWFRPRVAEFGSAETCAIASYAEFVAVTMHRELACLDLGPPGYVIAARDFWLERAQSSLGQGA